MTKDIFNQKISPSCAYCANGIVSSDPEKILCPKKGIVTQEYHCRKFVYEPLKRIPKKPLRHHFTKEDFTL